MPFLPIDNLPGKGKFRPKPVLPPVRGGDRRRGAFPCLALRALDHGSDLVVDFLRDRSRILRVCEGGTLSKNSAKEVVSGSFMMRSV